MAVFFYDLLRTTRRGRVVLLRAVYGLVLLAALGGLFVRWLPDHLTFEPGVTRESARLARFAEQFAAACLLVQLGAAIVLAPAAAAGAIAEERQRRTLDLLRACGLPAGQIVLGKLASRALTLGAILLTSLPALMLAQLWGGVDARFLVAGTAVNLLTVLSLTALGVFCSALTRSPPAAAALAYVIMGGFAALTGSTTARFVNPAHVYAEWLNTAVVQPTAAFWFGPLVFFALFHVAATAILAAAAARCLRPVRVRPDPKVARARAIRRMPSGLRRDLILLREHLREALAIPLARFVPPRHAVQIVPPPPVGEDPLLWKERYYGSGGVASEALRTAAYVLIVLQPLLLLAPAVALLTDASEAPRVAAEVRPLAVTLGITMLGAAALGVTAYAAAGLSGERERRTLDPLLTLPGGRWDVLRAKWVGSLSRLRGVIVAAAVPWVVSFLLGAMHPLAVLVLIPAATAHLTFFAGLGLWVSARAGGTGRAVLTAVAVAVLVATVPPLLVGFDPQQSRPLVPLPGPWREASALAYLSPPVVWWLLGRSPRQWPDFERAGGPWMICLSVVLYGVAAAVLPALAAWRLRRAAFREGA